jgi:mutator protein MutT
LTSPTRLSIHVVAAAVTDAAGRVLIAQRPAGKHMAGWWEFPGGKLEPGEDLREGLQRELREELGIKIETPRPLLRLHHSYPDRDVLLDIWVVRHFSGEPQALDHQALRWCTRSELEVAELLPADRPIVRALQLPERLTQLSTREYTISDLPNVGFAARLRGVLCEGKADAAAASEAGADFLALRGELPTGEIIAICRAVSLPVYVRAIALEEAWSLGASGLNEITERLVSSSHRNIA